jgi:hypothetical protein
VLCYRPMRWHLFLVAAVLCAGCQDTQKANEKVAEFNKALNEGKDLLAEAEKHRAAADGSNVEVEGKKCAQSAGDAAEKFETAAKLATEASEMKVQKIFAEYLGFAAKAFEKRAEHAATAKKLCQSMVEQGVGGSVADTMKLYKDLERLDEEAREFGAKAEKIQKDNPTDFK